MEEDSPSMYSPVALPSRLRAAPAKNRSWSAPTVTSSERINDLICPVLRLCSSTSSSAWASIASASLSRADCRCDGVVRRHSPKAASAARTASSTSSGVDLGERPVTSPVVGSTSSVNSVAAESTSLPFT